MVVLFFSLVLFISMVLFVLALMLLVCQLFTLFHALSSHCNLRLLADLGEVDQAHLAEALEVTSLLGVRHQLPLIYVLLQVLGFREARLNVLVASTFLLPFRW